MSDKLLPHATELEELVLGACLLESEAFSQVSDFLRPEMFYKPEYRVIYEAIEELEKKDSPVDMRTVSDLLRSKGNLDSIGGPYFVAQLTSSLGSAANIQYHARIVAEKWMKREMIKICSEAIERCYNQEDVFDTANNTVQLIEQMSSFKTNDFTPKGRLSESREAIYKAHNSPNGLSGVSTGYGSLDQFTGGLTPGDLIIGGGMPGTFKTALSLSILHNAERSGIPVLMFEQEMSGRQVGMREIAMKTGIPTEDLKTGKVSKDQLQQIEMAIGQMEDKKVFIDLSSGITVGRIKSISKRMKKEHGIGLVVIDYLGLMNLEQRKYGGQEQAIDNTVKEIKILAKNLDIPIILLAQFSRESAKNVLQPPMMSYLKGSGAIEAHADACWLLWNPAQFDPSFMYDYGNGNQVYAEGKIAIVHAKNRQGRVGMQWLNVNPATNTFSDIDQNY